MNEKYGILVISATILVLSFVGTSSARTWYVDDSGGANFTGIQEAISAASDGDNIVVRDGIYTETVNVNKTLTIRSTSNPKNTIVKAANPRNHVFNVTADYVNISGFTVMGGLIGICLWDSNNNNISDNNCSSNNDTGIALFSSCDNEITNNTANLNNMWGIDLWESSNNNTITDNNASSNFDTGIELLDSTNNSISNNNCSHNTYYGIFLAYSNNSGISNNTCSYNIVGIYPWYSNNNSISNNTCPHNRDDGIFLAYSNDSAIVNNTCSYNMAGIFLTGKANNNSISNTSPSVIPTTTAYPTTFAQTMSMASILKVQTTAYRTITVHTIGLMASGSRIQTTAA
jgi:parallel beta-helix repeat protein